MQVVSKRWYTYTELTDDSYLSKQNTLSAWSHVRDVPNRNPGTQLANLQG